MRKDTPTVIFVLLLIISALIFFYPDFSDYWNSLHQTEVITDYEESMKDLDEEDYTEIFDLAQKYNEDLASSNAHGYKNGEPVNKDYVSLLNPNDTNMMGYVTIDKIDVDLPIYHGTADSALAIGAGHLEGSSLPIGGESSHTVITGHRGLATATLFTDLNEVEVGDVFTLSILSKIFTYKVDQILIVEPKEIDNISIIDGEDYCTLVTCTPYGINTDRILVRGTRIPNDEKVPILRVTPEAELIDPMIVVPFVIIPVVMLLLISTFVAPLFARKRVAR